MKPILFNTEMVKAILEGRKTVTRRTIKKKYSNTDIEYFTNKYGTRLVEMQNDAKVTNNPDGSKSMQLRACREIKQPYQVGDILYVRETWQTGYKGNIDEKGNAILEYLYKANGDDISTEFSNGKWRPSIHMPKSAARLFLKVTDVRVEKLQNMKLQDFLNEGVKLRFPNVIDKFTKDIATGQFIEIWDSTIKKSDINKYSWKSNPWVWVIEFVKIDN